MPACESPIALGVMGDANRGLRVKASCAPQGQAHRRSRLQHLFTSRWWAVTVERLRRMRRNSLFELTFTVAVALGLALCVQAYALKPYRIPSGSMEPTLQVGQRVLV